jgi:hypothetical protein
MGGGVGTVALPAADDGGVWITLPRMEGFSDDSSCFATVAVPSSWRREAAVDEAATQTLPVKYQDSDSQTTVKTTSEVRWKGRLGVGEGVTACCWGGPAAPPPALCAVCPLRSPTLLYREMQAYGRSGCECARVCVCLSSWCPPRESLPFSKPRMSAVAPLCWLHALSSCMPSCWLHACSAVCCKQFDPAVRVWR